MRKTLVGGSLLACMSFASVPEIIPIPIPSIQEQAERKSLEKAEEILEASKVQGALPSKEWKMITLSHLTQGISNLDLCVHQQQECTPLLEEILSETGVKGKQALAEPFPENGLYLAHLNIVLGSYQKITHNNHYRKLNHQVSEILAQWSLEDPQKHVRSYAKLKHKWPADQAAVLYSLHLYDQNYGTTISQRPIREWLDFMQEEATNQEFNLPHSNITNKPHANIPRGCALSWSVMYMSHFAPTEAKALWLDYKKHFWEPGLLFSGFREWPIGEEHGQDSDSGPIVYGIGASASAFGMAAAKLQGDKGVFSKIEHDLSLAQLFLGLSSTASQSYQNPLAQSLLFYIDSINL